MDAYKHNPSGHDLKEPAGIAAVRLARFNAGASKKRSKENRLTACVLFRIAQRLGAPLEEADLAYLDAKWPKKATSMQKLAKRVEKHFSTKGTVDNRLPAKIK
jgi:hypothetical protein